MSNREIGKITSVGLHGVIADVDSDLGNYINTINEIFLLEKLDHMCQFMKQEELL